MVDRVVINDATYATLLNHCLSTQAPSEALLLGGYIASSSFMPSLQT